MYRNNIGPPNMSQANAIDPPDPNNYPPVNQNPPNIDSAYKAKKYRNIPTSRYLAVQQRIPMGPGLSDKGRLYEVPTDKRTIFLNAHKRPFDPRITNGHSSVFRNDFLTVITQGTMNNNDAGVYPIDNEFTHVNVVPTTFQTKQDWHLFRKAVEKIIMRQADCNYWLFYIYQKLDHYRFDGTQPVDGDNAYVEDLRIGTYGSEFFRKLDFGLVYDRFYRFINKVFVPTIKLWKKDDYLNEKKNVACYAIHNMMYMVVRHLVTIREYYESLFPNRELNQKRQRRDPAQLRIDIEKTLNKNFNIPNTLEYGRALGAKWNQNTVNAQDNQRNRQQQFDDQANHYGQNWWTPHWWTNMNNAQQNIPNNNNRNARYVPATTKEKLHYLKYKLLSFTMRIF